MADYQVLAYFKSDKYFLWFVVLVFVIALIFDIIFLVRKHQYKKTSSIIQQALGIDHWLYRSPDDFVSLKSSRSVDSYDIEKYFKDHKEKLLIIYDKVCKKNEYYNSVLMFLDQKTYIDLPMYRKIENEIRNDYLMFVTTFNVEVSYVSPAGRSTNIKLMRITQKDIKYFIDNPTALMNKSEFNQYEKSLRKNELDQKQKEYYNRVNALIDYANEYRDKLIIAKDQSELDNKIASLFDRTVNSIKRIKEISSEEWTMVHTFISRVKEDVRGIVNRNQLIIDYYESSEFETIKNTCFSMMDSQREFNEYINEKAQAISSLFGKNVIREDTIIDDEYNYIRPYKKTLSPFTAEVSAQVFASAENNPMDYIIKYFYPNKSNYPLHIQKLHLLIEELATLREARQIIDNYKKTYQKYISDVPDYVMKNDEDGFYSRLGFANVNESALTVAYHFAYTSGGGMAQRSFSVPMREDTIIELINRLENKLTLSSFTKEQRSLMTSKLRQKIKERDNYTCRICGNTTLVEPNLLLEIDHIIPVSKGGYTVEDNLQTLCWKCNRAKRDKIHNPPSL